MGCLLGDRDKKLFDSIAQEVNKLVGTTAIVYQLIESDSSVDPLYGEPISTEYKRNAKKIPGIECPVYFTRPDKTQLVGEEGYRIDTQATISIADKDLVDRGLREPTVGDIFKVWNKWWDVMNIHQEGIPNDNPTTSLWVVDVVRRTKAPPESLEIDLGL